jgi:hypothetical protein
MFGRGVYQDGMLWAITNRSDELWGYVPAQADDKDWMLHDRWVGPFVPNGGGLFISLLAGGDGCLFATTTVFVDRVNTKTMMETAQKRGMAVSTAQFQRKLEAKFASPPWQVRVGNAILDKRWDDALAITDEQLAAVARVTDNSPRPQQNLWSDAMLWRALAYARAGYYDEACDVYAQVAASAVADGPAKAMARLNRLSALYIAHRWQDMLDETDALSKQFPALAPAPGPDPLYQHVALARKNLAVAATQPALQAKDTHAPARVPRTLAIETASAPAILPTTLAAGDNSVGASLLLQFKTDKVAAIAALKQAGASAVAGLVEGLKSSDADTRLAAATMLRILGPKAVWALDDLITAAAKDTSEVRNEAFMAFGDMGSAAKAAVPLLMAALREADKSPRAAFLASFAIMRIAPDEPGLADVLIANLKNTEMDATVRSSSAAAIGGMKDPPKSAGPVMIGLLEESSPSLRVTGISSLHKFVAKDKLVPMIVPLIKDDDKQVRIRALITLRDLGPDAREALPNVMEALKDQEKWVQEIAIGTVGHLGKAAQSAIPTLKAIADGDAEPRLRRAADFAIKAIDRATD